MSKKIKPLAFYLPQYHPTAQNDLWWGKGFTEWTNVSKAKPLFKGHEQPIYPADFGYYDLRLSEVREEQAELARSYGVYGFIYYHYWFGDGEMVLEKIAEQMLASNKPDFPFCFCWANETWSGIWHGLTSKILAEQKYLGEDDVRNHLSYLSPFFRDERYIKVNGNPLFMIYDPEKIPNVSEYIDLYRRIAKEFGFNDLYIMVSNKGKDSLDYLSMGFDAKVSNAYNAALDQHVQRWNRGALYNRFRRKLSSILRKEYNRKGPVRLEAKAVFEDIKYSKTNVVTYPVVLPNWDNTPRSARRGIVFENSSPKLFRKELEKAVNFLKEEEKEENFLIIKSWNEWAEGNILEPDRRFGHSYLEQIKECTENG